MPKTLWTPAMVELLLEHLETHKGDQGLYTTDRQAAFEEVAVLLNQLPLSNPVNAKQVRIKLEKLAQRYSNSKRTNLKTLFSQGRSVLREPYNRRVSGSSKNEDTRSDDHGSSYKSSDQELPKHPTQKRPPLETPPAPQRKSLRVVFRLSHNPRVSGSSENEDDEHRLFDDHGSSYKNSDQELPKHSAQKRQSLETPPSPRRKKSK